MSFFLSYNFLNLVNVPTRVQGSSSSIIIDHCYIRKNDTNSFEISINNNTISDHYGIEILQKYVPPCVPPYLSVGKGNFLTIHWV
jgi:hypothetical protein